MGSLGWLGLRTLQQDRELEGQRRRERLEVAAGRMALEIERRLLDIEEQLGTGNGVRLLPSGIESSADVPVLFQPIETPVVFSSSELADGEMAEYQRRDLPAAAEAYRRLASTGPESQRGAALVALGRVRRLQKDYAGALEAYDALQRLGPVIVAGQPAGLVAIQGRCKTLEMAGHHDQLRADVRALTLALESGTWRIDRATFDFYQQLVQQWGGTPVSPSGIARTEAAIELWHAWRRGDLPPRGRRLMVRQPVSLLSVWAGDGDRMTLWVETASGIEERWRPLWHGQAISIALSDLDGRRFLGTVGDRAVSLAPSDTRLPFILNASLTDRDDGTERTRRSVLVIGLVLAFSVMSAAAYAVYRTTARELALARQQADFVSAVSHEFRTPLTSMRHLTDLLVTGSIRSDERRAQYYELLARETERLHRMVESLLSFGRMDVDAYAWQLEPADVDRIATEIVEEFRRESLATGRQVSCEIENALPPIRGDAEALSRALWNLLENASKYSEAGTPIHVFANRQGESVLLGVRDQGIGIPAVEQRRIFEKFVRGSNATRSGIRGVGLGLALVTRIVEAHGGSVRLDSEPGRGSTFTLVLPCLGS